MRALSALILVIAAAATTAVAASAHAQTSPPPPAPLPWLLRPTGPATVLRSDTAVAVFDDGSATTSILQGNYAVRQDLAVGLRVAGNVLAPDDGDTTSAFANPALLALWSPRVGLPVKLAVTGVVVLPLGQGAGADADPATSATVAAGVQTRQGMDNALFATNYATAVVGVGASWTRGPFAVVGEMTLLELVRVRDVPQDDARTNFTSGLHLAYSPLAALTLSCELHYQRWLSTPAVVDADPERREQATWLVGARGWFKVGELKLRPGLSYARAIDAPMGESGYHIVQVDIPIVF
jgi:hypothetical protein